MSFFENIYDFDTPDAPSNLEWDYINPRAADGLNISGTLPGAWNWNDGRTPSPKVGPRAPFVGGGYIYTESSAPTTGGDKFIMVTKNAIDASYRNIELEFRYSADTNNDPCQLIVEVFYDGGWHKEFDQNIGSDESDWIPVLVDLSMYQNTDMLIRITIDVLDTGSIWQRDIGIDNIRITGLDVDDSDEIITFLQQRDVRVLYKNKGTFDAKHIDVTNIEAIVADLKNSNLPYTNYPNGIIVVESQNKIRLIKEVV